MTMRSSHLAPSHVAAAVEKLEAALVPAECRAAVTAEGADGATSPWPQSPAGAMERLRAGAHGCRGLPSGRHSSGSPRADPWRCSSPPPIPSARRPSSSPSRVAGNLASWISWRPALHTLSGSGVGMPATSAGYGTGGREGDFQRDVRDRRASRPAGYARARSGI